MEDIPSYTQYPPTKIRHLTKDVRNISSTRASGILDLSASMTDLIQPPNRTAVQKQKRIWLADIGGTKYRPI